GSATDTDSHGAEAAGFGDRAEHVRSAPAGSDPDQHVGGGEAARLKVANADRGIVFGGFGGAAEGGLTPRNDSLDQVGRDAKGRGTFGGVEDAEPSAGAGSDVKEAATVLHGSHDGVHGARNV